MMKRFIITTMLLVLAFALSAQWLIDEDFEGLSTLPTGWSIVDDGDAMTWRNINTATNAHSGTRAAFVDNYLPNQNADWLISPQLSISEGDSLIFYTRSWVSTENLKVFVSTTGNQPSQLNTQIAHLQNIGTSYQTVRRSLQQFAGQNIYIGFFWQCSNYGILIDDIKIGQTLNIIPELNLPQEVSFFQGESLNLDFAPYAVYTDIETVSLTVSPNLPISVSISGLQVVLSSPDYAGTQELSFTLLDGSSGLSATDTITVIVHPTPAIDLSIQNIISPRPTEYLAMPFSPEISVANLGNSTFDDQFELSLNIRNPEGELLSTQNMFFPASLASGQSVVVSFPETFSLASLGIYSCEFQILNPDANMLNNTQIRDINVVLRITSGGPDNFGYRYIDSNDPLGPEYSWIDISTTGASTIMYQVPSFSGDDNFSEPIPLGFSFPFYGSQYSSAYVDTNGELLLADNSWYTNYPGNGWANDGNMFNYMYPIPGYVQMPALIAVYWDDLEADQGVGDLYFQSFGESPARYTIFQWHNLRYNAGSGGNALLKFQLILHENGEILMQYHTTATGQSGSVVPHNNGLSATVAIQNQAANAGLCYLREIVQNGTYLGVEPAGNLLHDNLAIRFYSGEDNQPPIITHKALGNTFQNNLSLKATIIDMNELAINELYWNTGAGWQAIVSSASEGNIYSYEMSDLPQGNTVQYYFSAVDLAGNSARLPLTGSFSFKVLPTADTQALVVYSGSQDYQRTELNIYESLLTQLNIPYDIYNWEEYPEYAFPDQYKALIAYANVGVSGDKSRYMATAMADYLATGTTQNPKHLWFASDGFASGQHGNPDSSPLRRLMSGYFRTAYVPTGFGGGSNGLAGPDVLGYHHGTILCLPGSPIGTPQSEYAVYANSPDCIFPNDAAGGAWYDEVPYPEIGANYIFAFEDGPVNGSAYLYHGVCATAVETPVYKTLYFSFDFSQLSNPAARLEWMQDITTWFALSPVANADVQATPSVTGLAKIYPNPFNPHTTISYHMAKTDALELAIYNIKGQKVKQLVQDTKLAGEHSIVWDGTDTFGKNVASGIYYIRLETTDKRETRKLTLIK